MKCPHCSVTVHASWDESKFVYHKTWTLWTYTLMPCPSCNQFIINIRNSATEGDWIQVYPLHAKRGAVSKEVPPTIAQDYQEACAVLALSPKASAALSRRCLQAILRAHGYVAKDLAKEIDLLLSDPDPSKAIPVSLRTTIDGIRNFGNFSAHPVTDQTTLQVIDVDPLEAGWCLEIIEEMFEHFYVRPAEAQAKKAALNAKLAAAGKPAAK